MSTTIGIGTLTQGGAPWNDVYYDDDLASGSNDGSSPANAWQSLSAMLSGVKPGDRVNMKKAASPVVLSASATFPAGGLDGAIWYRGYGSEPGDGTKWIGQAGGSFAFIADNGPQLFSDISFTGVSSTSYVVRVNSDDQTTFYKCAFSSDSSAECLSGRECTAIACTFSNTGTFSSGGYECWDGDGVAIGCDFEGEGDLLNLNTGDESEHVFLACCTLQIGADNSGIELGVFFEESSFSWLCELSIDGGNGSGRGIGINDIDPVHESARGAAYCAVYDCDDGAEMDEATIKEWPLFKGMAMGSNATANYTGFGDWEDLFETTALTAAPWTGSGDFAPNATAGGGAVLRDGGTIGYIAGSGVERYTSAFNIGGYRHGTDDGGDADPLVPSSQATGGGLSGRDFGLLPVNKTSEIT